MPKTETLDERSARVAAEAAEIAAERARVETERARALAEHQSAYDAEIVARWAPRELEQAVRDARVRLDEAIRADPLTRALADYVHAQMRRSDAHNEHIGALSRLGRPSAGAQAPPTTAVPDLAEEVARLAGALAAEALAAEREAFHTRRNTTPEETP